MISPLIANCVFVDIEVSVLNVLTDEETLRKKIGRSDRDDEADMQYNTSHILTPSIALRSGTGLSSRMPLNSLDSEKSKQTHGVRKSLQFKAM